MSLMHVQVPAELEKLLPVAEARPLEVAVVAPGDADNVLQALLASGANVSGEDGARAVMTGLASAKRARVHSLLDCQVCACFFTTLFSLYDTPVVPGRVFKLIMIQCLKCDIYSKCSTHFCDWYLCMNCK